MGLSVHHPTKQTSRKISPDYWEQSETIVNLIRSEALRGLLYTPKEFALAFERKNGLKSWRHIYGRIQEVSLQANH